MAGYKLSVAADGDFEDILEFGIDRFGVTQALEYQHGLIAQFDLITVQPELYAKVDSIKIGYRRCVYNAHSIYYRMDGTQVLIVRILGRQNPISAI